MFIFLPTDLSIISKKSILKILPLFEQDNDFSCYIINPYSIPVRNLETTEQLKSHYPIIGEYQKNKNDELAPKDLYSIVSNEEMRKFLIEINTKLPWTKDKIHIHSKLGESPIVLGTYFLSYKPDLVVLPVQSHDITTEIQESILFYFMNNTNYPVLVVPEDINLSKFEEMTTVFNHENETDFDITNQFENTFSLSTSVVNFSNEALDLPQYKDVTPALDFEFDIEEIKTEKPTSEQLIDYLKVSTPSILAVSSRRKLFFKHLFSSTTAKHILSEGKTAILCMPEKTGHSIT